YARPVMPAQPGCGRAVGPAGGGGGGGGATGGGGGAAPPTVNDRTVLVRVPAPSFARPSNVWGPAPRAGGGKGGGRALDARRARPRRGGSRPNRSRRGPPGLWRGRRTSWWSCRSR